MDIAWFRKKKKPRAPIEGRLSKVPEGLWVRCEGCKQIIYEKEVVRNANVCPKCNYHFRISARERLNNLLDNGIFEELDTNIHPIDALKFKDHKSYKDRLKQYRERTGMADAIINARGTLGGFPVLISVMEYGFMGGSMGSVVGEKITRAIERCLEE